MKSGTRSKFRIPLNKYKLYLNKSTAKIKNLDKKTLRLYKNLKMT